MIAIASYIYLSVGGIVGAIMFSIGLLTILNIEKKYSLTMTDTTIY